MTCDSNRPCARCVKRNIGHLCHDEIKDKSQNGTESTSQSPAVEPTSPEQAHVDGEIKTGKSVVAVITENRSCKCTATHSSTQRFAASLTAIK